MTHERFIIELNECNTVKECFDTVNKYYYTERMHIDLLRDIIVMGIEKGIVLLRGQLREDEDGRL
jgi:hypothetical protein